MPVFMAGPQDSDVGPCELATEHKHSKQTLHENQEAQLKQLQFLAALQFWNVTDVEDLEEPLQTVFKNKTPVSVLTELANALREKVYFVEVGQPTGPSHKPRFTIVAALGDRLLQAVRAGSKREAQRGAAFLGWQTLIQEEQQKLVDLQKTKLTLHEQVALLSHLEYYRLVERNPACYSGRRILAAIIMKTRKKDTGNVISLATGNRCISGNHITMDGTVVNDCHAEVLAKRAFQRFLNSQLKKHELANRRSIFECGQTAGKLRVKSNISFHLYISTAPCGDAALFSKTETEHRESTEPIFTTPVQGLLRTKLEAGEGAIPADEPVIQTWVGFQLGQRLRTMSCSDKILKWNVLGMQGALLSHVLEPVYLSSITIGDNYVYGHLSRAVYYRLLKNESMAISSLPADYMPTSPELGHSGLPSVILTEKTNSASVHWSFGDDKTEIVDGNTGKLLYGTGDEVPTVCKSALYSEFQQSVQHLKHQPPEFDTYNEAKVQSNNYQLAKKAFLEHLHNLKMGYWISKPEEAEYFV